METIECNGCEARRDLLGYRKSATKTTADARRYAPDRGALCRDVMEAVYWEKVYGLPPVGECAQCAKMEKKLRSAWF